jgi:hypothetical protein
MTFKVLFVAFMLLISTSANAIVNGKPSDYSKNTFFVRIMEVEYRPAGSWYIMENHCGGTILNESYILTATHCVNDSLKLKHLYVLAGNPFLGNVNITELKEIERVYLHPEYSDRYKDEKNDIAIIKLKTPITDNVDSVTLPSFHYNDYPESIEAIALGGGRQNPMHELDSHVADHLREAKLNLMGKKYCVAQNDTNNFICTRNRNEETGIVTSTSSGDSGSALMFLNKETNEYYQVGIASSTSNYHDSEYSRSMFEDISRPDKMELIKRFSDKAPKTHFDESKGYNNFVSKGDGLDEEEFFNRYIQQSMTKITYFEITEENKALIPEYEYGYQFSFSSIFAKIMMGLLTVFFACLTYMTIFYIMTDSKYKKKKECLIKGKV